MKKKGVSAEKEGGREDCHEERETPFLKGGVHSFVRQGGTKKEGSGRGGRHFIGFPTCD